MLISGPIPDASHKKSREVAHLINKDGDLADRVKTDERPRPRRFGKQQPRVYCKSELFTSRFLYTFLLRTGCGTQCIWTVYFSVFGTGLETQCIYMNTLYLQCIAHVPADPLLHRSATTPCSEREQLRLPSGLGRGVRAPGHGSVPISPDHQIT